MTHEQFIQLVRHYRNDLKMYQRTKHYIYAQEIKTLEREIDVAIADYLAERKRKQNIEIDFPPY